MQTVYRLGSPSQAGAGSWVLSFQWSLQAPVLPGHSCLLCCLTVLAAVRLGKAKH